MGAGETSLCVSLPLRLNRKKWDLGQQDPCCQISEGQSFGWREQSCFYFSTGWSAVNGVWVVPKRQVLTLEELAGNLEGGFYKILYTD